MNDSTGDDKGDLISQAAWWFTRLGADDWGAAEEEAFDRWLFADPMHQEELAAQFDMQRLLRDAAPQLIPPLQAAEHRQRHRRSLSGRIALAASLLVAIGLFVWFRQYPQNTASVSYTTHTGETRTVRLADGSVVYLNTRTRLEWTGNSQDRSVRLHEGEALFKVTQNAAHPFRVIVGQSEIRVLGTEFNVYRKKSGAVAVTVLSGSVEVRHSKVDSTVWKQVLRENERLVYRMDSSRHEPKPIEAANAVAWREGVLKIVNEPLPEALEELGRYTDRRILAPDPRLAHLRVAATVTTRDARAALTRLTQLAPIAVTESPDGFVLTYRDPDAPKP